MYFNYPSWSGSTSDPSLQMPPPPPGLFTAQDPLGRSRAHATSWSGAYESTHSANPSYHDPHHAHEHERHYTNPHPVADDGDGDQGAEYVRPKSHPPPPPPQPQPTRRTRLEEEYFDMWDYVRMNRPIPGFPRTRAFPHARPYEFPQHPRAHEFPPYLHPHMFPHPPPHTGHPYSSREAWARFRAWDHAQRQRHWDEWERRQREKWDQWERRFFGGENAKPPENDDSFQYSHARPDGGWREDAWGRARPEPEQRSSSRDPGDNAEWWRRPPRPDTQRPFPHEHTRSHSAHPTRTRSASTPEAFETTLTEAFAVYDAAWSSLPIAGCGEEEKRSLTFRTVPWPQHPSPCSVDDIDAHKMRDFLGSGGRTMKVRLREALLRFHPDKTASLLARVVDSDKALVAAACEAVTRCLGDLMRSATI